MKAHRLEVEVTTKYIIEVHGENEAEATQTAENMDNTQIEAAGDFVESVKVEVTDIEVMYPEDEEEDERGETVEHIPNALTVETLEKSERGEDIEEFVDLDSLKAPEEVEEESGEDTDKK